MKFSMRKMSRPQLLLNFNIFNANVGRVTSCWCVEREELRSVPSVYNVSLNRFTYFTQIEGVSVLIGVLETICFLTNNEEETIEILKCFLYKCKKHMLL